MADRKILYRAGASVNEVAPLSDNILISSVDSQTVPFVMRAGGSDRVHLLTGGQLSIGAPALISDEMLSVQKTIDGSSNIRLWNGSNTANASCSINVTAHTGSMQIGSTPPSHTANPLFTGGSGFLATDAVANGFILVTQNAAPIRFATSNAERMRILSTGEVCIGPTTSFGGLVNIQSKVTNDNTLAIIRGNGAGFGGFWSFHDGNATAAGTVGHSGPVLGSGSDMAVRAATGKTLFLVADGGISVDVRPATSGNMGFLIKGFTAGQGGFVSFYDGLTTLVGHVGHSGPTTGGGTDLAVLANTGKAIRFYTNGLNERGRWLSTGELVLGATALIGTEKLRVAGASGIHAERLTLKPVAAGSGQIDLHGTGAGDGGIVVFFDSAGAQQGAIGMSNIVVGGSSTGLALNAATGTFTLNMATAVTNFRIVQNTRNMFDLDNAGTMILNLAGINYQLNARGNGNANLFNVLGVAGIDAVVVNAAATADSAKFYVNGKISTSDEMEINGALNHDGTTAGLFGANPTTQAAAKTNLTDSTGGTVDGTLADVGGAFDQTTLNNNFADIADRLNHVLNIVRNLGAMAT